VRIPHRRRVELFLVAEVIVDRGDVGAGGFADLADRDLGEATLSEESCRAFEQPLASLAIAIFHSYSVRLKSIVAAVIATIEKTRR